MKKHFALVPLIIILGLVLAACGGGGGSASDVAAGDQLFHQTVIGTNAGCVTCHSTEKGVTIVGPSLAEIATTAATAEPGMTAEAFIKESIVDPNKVVTQGFNANIMPQNWSQVLTEQQIDQLVAYLMTLK
jgi:cytochrome c551/c552